MTKCVRIFKIPLGLALFYILITIVLPSTTVLALTPAQKKVIDSGIYDFNTEEDVVSTCTASGTSLSGSDNKEKIWNFFVGKGLTPPQAAGIMGNLQAESGENFDPTADQGGPGGPVGPNASNNAYGIAQWDANRRVTLENTAKSQGVAVSDLGFQLNFLYNESINRKQRDNQNLGEWDGLKQQQDAASATYYWHRNFERSGDGPDKIQNRIGFANALLAELGSTTPGAIVPSSSSSSSCSGSTASAAAVVQTALLYSWPEKGHGLTPKPEYAAAVAKYNAGVSYNGADCGAFVATVMRATGADPDYPRVGTIAQEAYVRSHPEKYDIDDTLKDNSDISKLLPGDIMLVNTGDASDPGSGHTYIFVGKQPPNDLDQAGASGGTRMPNLGHAEIVDSQGRGNYIRARLK